MADVTAELTTFFERGEVNVAAFEELSDLALENFQSRERFAELVSEYRERVERGAGEAIKLALALLVLGRFKDALDWFSKTPDGKFRRYFAAKAAAGLGRLDEAQEELQQARAKGWDEFEADMAIAAIHIRRGHADAARELADKHAEAGQDRAEWYYVQGLLQEHANQRTAAIEQFEKALTLEPEHAPAMFRCARLYDLSGDDEQAIGLYEQLAESPRAYVNALLNLAVIYEDLGDYEEALRCLQRVLKAYPNHTRARLFFKDVESCRDMIVEEAGDLQIRPRDRLLDTPLSDFELSVRARNCLKKMNIRSLGDLVRLTEAELLSYKNFGDTSLSEIKALLSKRGLRLGQAAVEPEVEVEQPEAPAPAPAVNVPPGHEAILNKPVSELELSVRARRCLQRLNVISIGDLIQLSDAELLATRNFGVTSLNEVKGRLTELGLQLASKPAE